MITSSFTMYFTLSVWHSVLWSTVCPQAVYGAQVGWALCSHLCCHGSLRGECGASTQGKCMQVHQCAQLQLLHCVGWCGLGSEHCQYSTEEQRPSEESVVENCWARYQEREQHWKVNLTRNSHQEKQLYSLVYPHTNQSYAVPSRVLSTQDWRYPAMLPRLCHHRALQGTHAYTLTSCKTASSWLKLVIILVGCYLLVFDRLQCSHWRPEDRDAGSYWFGEKHPLRHTRHQKQVVQPS